MSFREQKAKRLSRCCLLRLPSLLAGASSAIHRAFSANRPHSNVPGPSSPGLNLASASRLSGKTNFKIRQFSQAVILSTLRAFSVTPRIRHLIKPRLLTLTTGGQESMLSSGAS
jgi:hypothetical protein